MKGTRATPRGKVIKMFRLETQISQYRNNGQRHQQNLDYQLTGKFRKADRVPFDKGSDIPEYRLSVKSYHFTLASDLKGETYEEMKADFFSRCHSERFAYVTRSQLVYIMNREQFAQFLDLFHELDRSSAANGNKVVIRGKREPKAMLKWLDDLDYMELI